MNVNGKRKVKKKVKLEALNYVIIKQVIKSTVYIVYSIYSFVASASFSVLMRECKWIRRRWLKPLTVCSYLPVAVHGKCSPVYTNSDHLWASALADPQTIFGLHSCAMLYPV